ncbi:unnamed protein product [Rhizophagus irregularis]|nr:unnamed protein product [Rhizophagus irregularis]
MHCLFLDIAKWIVKRIWVDEKLLTLADLNKIQAKMNEFHVPSDLGRIPCKINCRKGFSNFTADQWQIFFTIYTTVALWEHLSVKDQKILTYFVRVCAILVSRIVEVELMREAHQKLIEIIKLIKEYYGQNKVSLNLHLSLHLCEYSYDYGPLYAFWCFSFERSLPNSNRKIEPEIMRRLTTDNRISDIKSSGILTKGLELLNDRPAVGSLSEIDQFLSDEMHRFWLNSRNIQESRITGSKLFPGSMLKPVSENVRLSSSMLDLIVEYYSATYETLNFQKPFGEGEADSIVIWVSIDKFGRCQIGSEVFGSEVSARHTNSSFVLAKFITNDGVVDTYPGQIQYFFTHTVDLPDGPTKHHLTYIQWYQHTNSADTRFYFSIDDKERSCNVELWNTNFYPKSRDCIIPVHNVLGRFVPVKYKLLARKNAKGYLAVNPVNRKLNIR